MSGSPDATDFSVLVNGSANTVTNAAVSGNTVVLTLTDVIPNSATVTWTYTQNSGGGSKLITGAASSSNATNAVVSVTANQSVTVTDDVSAPTVSSVALKSGTSGVQGIGDVVPIEITFSEVVVVTGTPTLELETGSTDATVSYTSGSGTNTLLFNYTVANTHATTDLAYKATTSLALPSGATIRDSLGTNGTLTLASPGASNSLSNGQNLVVDGVIPTISAITTTAGTQAIAIAMSESVTGSPQTGDFAVKVNTVAKTVSSIGVSGSAITLTMAESIPNDATVTVAYTQNSSAYITGTNGGNKVATVSIPQNVTVTNDNTRPTITDVSGVDKGGGYTDNDVVPITVTFSEVVVVTGGNAQLELETGSSDALATYVSGSGTNALLFNYTVGAGETSSDLDYKATSSFKYILQNASIKDNAGNLAVLDLASPGASGSLAHGNAIEIA